jgi:hypothetical protein
MNINDLTIGQVKELISEFGNMSNNNAVIKDVEKQHPYAGKKVLVRTYSSGVHFGVLKDYDSNTRSIFLNDSQRIHQWEGAFTMSKIATDGITGGRISCKVNEIYIEQVIELILIETKALESIAKLGIHNE